MQQKEVKEEVAEEKTIDTSFWDNLLYKLDEADTKILMGIYYPEPQPYILEILHKRLKTVHISYSGLRKKLVRLDKYRILTVVKKTRPLCIYPNDVNLNMTFFDKLIVQLCLRHGLKNIKFGGLI